MVFVCLEIAMVVGIAEHRDGLRLTFSVKSGLSIASCVFRLRKLLGPGKWQRVTRRLEPRSAYLLSGPARREWEHSIPPVEALRYSLTFRNLRDSTHIRERDKVLQASNGKASRYR
jgi:hypothetical protein